MKDMELQERIEKGRVTKQPQGKTPPHSTEAERGLIGCVLLGGLESLAKCKTVLIKGRSCFYDLRHQVIWEAFEWMENWGTEIDVVTLYTTLEKAKQLAASGGATYFNELPDATPSASNWAHYAQKVWETYMFRSIAKTCSEAAARAWEGQGDLEELIDDTEQSILGVCQLRKATAEQKTAKQLVRQFIDTLEEGWQNGRIGYQTGLPALDGLMGDMRPGNMIVLGAAPSIGKSSLASNIAANNCAAGIPVGVFTLEMSSDEWLEMIVANETGYRPRAMEMGGMEEESVNHVRKALEVIYKWPLYICDNGEITIQQLRSQARRWRAEHGIKMLIVDYLQLVQGGKKFDNLTNEVTHISKQIKSMAKELQVPVLVLASLSRDSRKENRKPVPEDLRQSGSIESDADKIIMLHPAKDDILECIVAKNRRGPKGVARCRFQAAISRFTSINEE